MGFPGNSNAPPVKEAIEATFKKIAAAKKIAGTPGSIDNIKGVLERGVLYTYTHLTKLIGYAGRDFFKAARQ
jgi:hypothetical protein